ncbi:MAG: hypothetical protein JW867_08875 [Candidatus Omnitrophica bacterium]|nr:hypothetical protein [Candidatus Omnitrophota bacterium]
MARKIIFLVLLLSCSCILSLFAETIVLNSGKQFEAKIIENTAEYIKVDIIGVPIKYDKQEIQFIGTEQNPVPTKEGLEEVSNFPKAKDDSKNGISIKIKGNIDNKATATRKSPGYYRKR